MSQAVLIRDSVGAKRALDQLMAERTVAYRFHADSFRSDVSTLSFAFYAPNLHFVIESGTQDLLSIFIPLFEAEDIYKINHHASRSYQLVKKVTGCDVESNVCLLLGAQCLTAGLPEMPHPDTLAEPPVPIETLVKKDFEEAMDFRSRAVDLGVMRTWQIENAAVPAFADMEFYGQKMDHEAWATNIKENEKKALDAKTLLDGWFSSVFARNEAGDLQINYDSPQQVLYGLQMLGIKVDGETIQSTGKSVQQKLRDLPPMRALESMRKAQHAVKMFGRNYLNGINPVTGRIHFKVNQYGTSTGRPASYGGLNGFNIPRDLRYRRAFITDPGRKLITLDYPAIEIRILAAQSGDKAMIEGFQRGEDFHCYTASRIFKKSVSETENTELRLPAKRVNFGKFYGIGGLTLFEQLNYEFNYPITEAACHELLAAYDKTFPTAVGYIKEQGRLAATQFSLSNPSGRRRWWTRPEKDMPQNAKWQLLSSIQREGGNFPMQSTNQDFMKPAMTRIRRICKKQGWKAHIANVIYDELVLDGQEDCIATLMFQAEMIMTEEAGKHLGVVPVQVKGHISDRWEK